MSDDSRNALRSLIWDELRAKAEGDPEFKALAEKVGVFDAFHLVDGCADILAEVARSAQWGYTVFPSGGHCQFCGQEHVQCAEAYDLFNKVKAERDDLEAGEVSRG